MKIASSFLGIAVLCLTFCLTPTSADEVLYLAAENNALDQTGNGHNGTLINGTGFAAGIAGQGFSFDGVDDYIEIAGSPDLEPTTFTVSLWLRTTDTSGGIKLIMDSSHGGSNGQFGWAVQSLNGRIGIAYGNGATFPGTDTTSLINDGDYHHFAATVDGTQMNVYLDGVLESTVGYSGTPMGTGDSIRLGSHSDFGRHFEGSIDEVRVYDEVLSGVEISRLANVPEPSSLLILAISLTMAVSKRRR